MSVYQVEEYYVYINVPSNKKVLVQDWLDENKPVCCTVEWSGDDLTIDGFDSESSAEDCNYEIDKIINGE